MLVLISILAVLASLIYIYAKVSYSYWEKRKLPTYPGVSMPFGSLQNIFSKKSEITGMQFKKFYDYFKQKGLKHGGVYMFQTPVYVPCDPELCKQIMTKDYSHFEAKGMYWNEKDQPLEAHLFNLDRQRWKNLRVKLSPTFTSGKIKSMFPSIVQCSTNMLAKVDSLSMEGASINVKDVCARYTTDVIGNCAFGIDCNSFEEEECQFRYYGNLLVNLTYWYRLQLPITAAFPKAAQFLRMVSFPPACAAFFTNLAQDMVKYREENDVKRSDFLQMMIDMKQKALITMDEINAQTFLIFVAGFETSSSAITHCLMELCLNPHVQDKVREEVQKVMEKHNNELTYECVGDMKYLEQCIQETLRKYPALPMLSRECTKAYKVPNSDIVLEVGTKVTIPLMGLQMDPEFYPDPETFDPDRFSDENKQKRHPYTWLPFGEGPRICIGMRFGILQTKVGLIQLLTHYKFKLAKALKTPIEYKHVVVTQIKDDIIMTATKL